MDKSIPRNLDYILAVNQMTALILLKVKKPREALEFIQIAQKAAEQLVEINLMKPMGQKLSDGNFENTPRKHTEENETPRKVHDGN